MYRALAFATLLTSTAAHCVLTSIEGANGVTMPGLTVADGTPRDCSSNRCGSQADTAIIRDREIASGEVGPLGRTQGNGPVDPAVMIQAFMGQGAAPTNNGSAASVGVEDDISGLSGANNRKGAASRADRKNRRQLGRLLGGLRGGNNGGGADAAGTKNEFASESSVAASAGKGATDGLPTSSDTGEVTFTMRQINQDGAGPMEATIDATSGGKDAAAFKTSKVTQDVPGAIAGLSLATTTDFEMKVQMPEGMTCEGSVGGATNVCILRVRNNTPAGPFGGSAAFTQSPAARKRAIAYRLKKRMEISRKI